MFGTLVQATFVLVTLVNIIFYTVFSTLFRHNILFKPEVFGHKISLAAEKRLGLKIILGTKIFLNNIFFCIKFFLDKSFWEFLFAFKILLDPISFMLWTQHFSI